jgi:actin-related protein
MNKILKEQKFQMTGCVAQECKVEAGQILGVGKIVSGSVGIVGKTYYLTLLLIDVKTGKVELSAEDECRCEIDELLGSTKRLAKKLLGESIEQPAEAMARAKTEEMERVKAAQIAKAKAEAEDAAREKARVEAIARAKAEEAEKAKAAQIAKAKAEAEEAAREKARTEAIARAKAEEAERAKAAQIARAKAEEERIKAEQVARAKAEEEKIKAERIARAKAEERERAKAAQIAKARAEAEEAAREKARAEATAKAEVEETARAKAKAAAIAKAEAQKHEVKVTIAAVDPAITGTKIVAPDGRYVKLGSGVVRDTQSGLEWYAGPDKNTSWDDVKGWVARLKVDGGDWRMPTITELKGLYRKGVGLRNMTPLLESTGWVVWSGETGGLGTIAGNSGWALDFDNGLELLDRRDNSISKRGFAVRSMSESAAAAIDTAAVSTKIIASDGRFEKLASGIVRDNQSGLDWYAGPDLDTGWQEAKNWADKLSIDGGGWRAPSLSELKSLYRKGTGSRNMTALLETTGWLIWSVESGGQGTYAGSGWALDFDYGGEMIDRPANSKFKRGFAVRSRTKDSSSSDSGIDRTRAVASDGRFEKLASGVVRDTKSNLEWYAGPDKSTSQIEAKAWAEVLKIDGDGWRMPNTSELKTLFHKGAGPRNMTPLIETDGWLIWSGETAVSTGGGDFKAWAVDFSDGRSILERRADSNYMRGFAVRSRK